MKKKKQSHFCAIFTKTLYSEEWKKLTKTEMLLYVYIKAGRNGTNDTRIKLPYSYLKGIMNKSTMWRALVGLIAKGWIEKTYQGGLMENESEYKLTLEHDRVLKR